MSCLLDIFLPISITGDCSNTNSGAFSVDIIGTAPDYTIQWISGSGGTETLTGGQTNYSLSGLSAGTYSFNIVDSCADPSPLTYLVTLYVSSGTCVSIIDIQNTTCSQNNGSITASTQNLYGDATFYLYDFNTDSLLSTQTSFTTGCTFSSLSAGTYYVIADDGGGCTGRSESCIVKSSTTLNYDLYIVNNAGCAGTDAGAIYVTNLDGIPPYTYLWSTSETTSYISGLTDGSYYVTVTDSSGCVSTKTGIVNTVEPVGLGAFITIPPSCFTSDGEVTVTITGGTGPYYYSGSNGSTIVTYSQTHTFTGLGSGPFIVEVKDAGLCSFVASTTLLSPAGFSVTTINVTPSYCSNSNGSISISLLSGISPFEYTLTDSSGNTITQLVPSPTWSFTNLKSDTYQLSISGGSCLYTTTIVLTNVPLLELNYSLTGTTCDTCDGAIELGVSGGSGTYTYKLTGQNNVTSSFSSNTFTNLCSGTYVASITDTVSLCTVTENIIIPVSPTVNFSLYGVNPTAYSNNGTISAFITNGTPPFTLTWNPNVGTGLNLTGLSADTYSLTVQDSLGCVQTKSITLLGYIPLSDYQIYNVCDTDFINSGILLTKGIKQMLNEGFYDLTSGDTNCILNQAIFTAVVSVDGDYKYETFYTGTTLNDYPTDEDWSNTIEDMLLSFEGITGVTINIVENNVKITTPCNTLSGSNVKVDLLINYDISCEALETLYYESPS